jgi:hypothetical protein
LQRLTNHYHLIMSLRMNQLMVLATCGKRGREDNIFNGGVVRSDTV